MSDFPTETAKTVFERTYSRVKPNGQQETWDETVERVVDGNLRLVPQRYIEKHERVALLDLIGNLKVLPAGRHIKSSGVNNFALNNCWAAGWDDERPWEHFTFTLLRLAEGGGVGANYSSRYLESFPEVVVPVDVHIVCDPTHADYLDLLEAGLISTEYSHEWTGAYEVADSREGWADALGDLIRTATSPKTKHEARVYDVSRVRPKGSPLKQFGGTASGPEPFGLMLRNVGHVLYAAYQLGGKLNGLDAMRIDHEIATCIVSGGVRRSARMSIMRWDDPLIHNFMRIKSEGGHWTTNISVEITDEFIAYLTGEKTDTFGPGGNEHAWAVMNGIADGMLRNGEPGIWNSSLTAVGEVDGTYTTNPCGEATLTEWEPCNLGSVNLGAFVDSEGELDWPGLEEAHRLLTRYLIRATFADVADPKSAEAIQTYRRIGVGHLGFADFLVKRGIRYSEAALDNDDEVRWDLADLAAKVDEAAAEYSNELRIPRPIKTRVIAPTGTISKLAGASGEGIHPPFAGYFIRRMRFSDLEPTERAKVADYKARGYHVEPDKHAANTSVVSIPTRDPLVDSGEEVFEHAGDLTLENMLAVQAMYQEVWADQAVSYTINVDPKKYKAADLIEALTPFLSKLKGTTVFPEMSFEQPPYERIDKATYERLSAELGVETADTSYDEICASGACPI